tara:strand:- start:2175 stop:3614 length:1440 start_codon:yes stop_codon:yes gene_type:complete
MKKKKILIYIPSDYYFYYFKYNAYKILNKNFNVHFLLNKDTCVHDKKVLKNFKYSFFKPNQKIQKEYSRLIYLGMAYNRKKSKSFKYGFKKLFPTFSDFIKIQKQEILKKKMVSFTFVFYFKNFLYYFNIFNKEKIFLNRIFLQLFSFPVLFKFYKRVTVDSKKNDILMVNQIKKINPDLIIYPTHCYEPESITLCKTTKFLKKKILFLIDNWDNISSKTIFLIKPDAVTVWGNQARKSALNLQSMKNSQIYHLGNPKFAEYFTLRNKKFKSPYSFPYVLYLGVLHGYDEMKPLKILDDEIEKNKAKYKNLKIIYRPHPGAEHMIEKCKKINFKNIVGDKQMENFLINKKKYSINNNHYFEKLIKNSLFMIGGLSTVTIESVIFGKRYLFLAHDEKGNISSPKIEYESHVHYNEILRLSLLTKCQSLKNLSKNFKNSFNLSFKQIDQSQNDKEINYFYDVTKKEYAIELNNIVNKVISN